MTNPIMHATCPYLGLAVDRTVMLGETTPDHRCYRQRPHHSPDEACQAAFCLRAEHVNCSFFQAAPVDDVTTAAKQAAPSSPHWPSPHWPSPHWPSPHWLAALRLAPIRVASLRAALQKALSRRAVPVPSTPLRSAPMRYQLVQTKNNLVGLSRWPPLLTLGSICLALCLMLIVIFANLFGLNPSKASPIQWNPMAAASPASLSIATSGAQSAPLATSGLGTSTHFPLATPISPLTSTVAATGGKARFVTPTAEPGGQVFLLGSTAGNAGWWKDKDGQRNHLGDSYLYAGAYSDETFISAVRFTLSKVPRGAPIREARLRLTGIRQDQFQANAKGLWLMQLVPESSLALLNSADFLTMLSAPAAITLFPPLSTTDLAPEQVNEWEFDETTRLWLENQLLDGATSVTLRIQASIEQGEALFAWDSGLGPETQGKAPALLLSLGPPPPTPPPLPTKPVIVATSTPIPQNVLTVVALANTATAVAVTTGTYTPVPYAVVTPTPFPANLETVQAVALARQLPAVILHTPTPNSAAMATRQVEYATAVALTTGTFTPAPTLYVTPMLVAPSPPAENVATEAARVIAATASANSGLPTSTPLPYNAVIAEYVYATPVPANEATAIADAVIATAAAKVNGTPTPLRWNNILITAVPSPTELPSATATPLPLLQSVTEFTPTPTSITLETAPDTLPSNLHNKIVFKTNRNKVEEVYALDPVSGDLYRINEAWVHPLAQKQMGLSPDRTRQAIVQAAADRTLQIHIFTPEYGSTRQLTAMSGSGRAAINYDPDWSPKGDQIVFVSTNSGNDEIYTVAVDGSIVTQLTMNNFEWDKHPCWSPDGNQIVFYSNRATGRRQLWIMNADGSGQRNLSNNEFEDWDPIWIR